MAVLEASRNAIISVDAAGFIRYANPQTEATFGYGRDELIGQPVERLIPIDAAERHVRYRAQPGAQHSGSGHGHGHGPSRPPQGRIGVSG